MTKKLKVQALSFLTLILAFALNIHCLAGEKLNEIYTNSTGINSWWTYPLSISNGGKTYTSYTTNEGLSGIMVTDNLTGKVNRVNLANVEGIDDHNAGAVEFLPDGRILYAVTGHCKMNYITVFISKKPYDISGWKKKKLRAEDNCTYVQIIKNNKGYFLFTRIRYKSVQKKDNGRSVKWAWVVSQSKDGISWTAFRNIVHGYGNQYYIKAMAVKGSSLIRLVTYSNPNAKANDIRLCFYNPAKNQIQNESGKTLYKITKNGVGLPYNKSKIIVKKEKNKSLRLLDVAYTDKKKTVIVYGTFSGIEDGRYQYLKYTNKESTTVTIVKSGKAFYFKSKYIGGVVFSEENPYIIYLSREKKGVWYIEKWKYNGNKFNKIKTIYKSKKKVAIRPFLDKYGIRYVNWSEGYYDVESFKKFDTYINKGNR